MCVRVVDVSNGLSTADAKIWMICSRGIRYICTLTVDCAPIILSLRSLWTATQEADWSRRRCRHCLKSPVLHSGCSLGDRVDSGENFCSQTSRVQVIGAAIAGIMHSSN